MLKQAFAFLSCQCYVVVAGIPRPASGGDLAERSMSTGWSSDREEDEGSRMMPSQSFGMSNKRCCDGLLLDVSSICQAEGFTMQTVRVSSQYTAELLRFAELNQQMYHAVMRRRIGH